MWVTAVNATPNFSDFMNEAFTTREIHAMFRGWKFVRFYSFWTDQFIGVPKVVQLKSETLNGLPTAFRFTKTQ